GKNGPSPLTFKSSQTTEIVNGMTNVTTYTLKIAATNANGTGPQSVATNLVTVGAPAKPTGPSAMPGNAQATVSWTAPANNGSAKIGSAARRESGGTGVAARSLQANDESVDDN